MKKNSTKKALLMSVLSLLLCVSMLIGTTYAWFTDTVTSASNIIKSGTLDVELTYADGSEDPATATFADASTGAIFNYELWEPGYTEVKHLGIANVGTLALKYQMRILANGVVSKLADVIDVYYYDTATKLTRANYATAGVKLGTLSEVINNFGEKVYGTLLAGESKTVTLALHMQESAGNEYQGLSIGTDFSVQLLATQYTYEEDSFDNQYDAMAEFEAQKTPSPMVNELPNEEIPYTLGIGGAKDTMILDATYQFRPTETYEQAKQSDYRWYHADFVVSADADVPANSVALAGYYKAWCQYNDEHWVALTSPDDIKAGDQIRLVKAMSEMGGGTITVAYDDLCNFGNDGIGFLCGLKALDAEALAGTTISVELRLYKTECSDPGCHHNNYACETGEYISAGVTKYTFPAVKVSTAAELKDALAKGISSIALADDVVSKDTTLTVASGKEVEIDLNGKTLSGVNTANATTALIKNSGNLTITGNGKISVLAENPDTDWNPEGFPTYASNTIANSGNLTIEDGVTIENQTAKGGASYAIDNYAGATLTVNGGKIIQTGGDVAIRMNTASATAENKVTINGGTISGKRAIWIHLAGSAAGVAPKVSLEINGGNFSGSQMCIYSYSYGNSFANTNVTFNGGEFNGRVEFGGGYKGDTETVTVNAGVFDDGIGRWVTADDFQPLA